MDYTPAGASSIEDVLAGALWVSGLTDPSLSLDSLHKTFMEVIFSFPAEDAAVGAAGSGENKEPRQRIRTAAELKQERRERRRLLREARDLRGEGLVYESEPSEEEDFTDYDEEDGMDLDRDFLDWINADGGADTSASVPRRLESRPPEDGGVTAVELELGRVGLGEEQETFGTDELPERLKEMEAHEKRPRLGPRPLSGGYAYQLPAEHEAYWILRQLRNAGQPLAHNTRICALANRPLPDIVDDPVLVAVAHAVKRMTVDFIEPAQLMLYDQTALHPLLCALLENSALADVAERSIPLSSYAYSIKTGRHQRPYVSESYVGFSFLGNRSIGEGDPRWRDASGTTDYAQRKPCFLELGRLLVRILELDALCHRLEYRRQQMLLMLRDTPEARVQDQRAALAATVFEGAVETGIWHAFVQSLLSPRTHGPYYRLRNLGLEEYYEEFSVTALQYQENLEENAPIHLCPSHSLPLHEWAEEVGKRVNRPGDAILRLFKDVIVEQFSKLPVLCKRVVDLFCAEGDLIVSHRSVGRHDELYPLASFFVEHPRQYLDLLHMERQGKVELFYVVNTDLVRRILNVNQLYQRTRDDDWSREREAAMELLVIELTDSLVSSVKAELLHQARYQCDVLSVQRLSLLCSQGAYEPTQLRLEDYDPEALVWEPAWNIVEAIPCTNAMAPQCPRRSARVCAAYRGDNGVTCFCFIDEYGTVIASTRWVDCALNSDTGRSTAVMQQIQLEKLFIQCVPAVLTVAASSADSLNLMRTLQRFLRDRVRVALRLDVPVVWAFPEVARFHAVTHFADRETPTTDMLLRTAIALARHVQDPLYALCVLFDSKRTIVQLCGSGYAYTSMEQQVVLYRRLCWEMSLWVAGCGMWLEDCIKRPNAVAMLQFVGGLGPTKARRLAASVGKMLPCSRSETKDVLTELLGEHVARNAVSSLRIAPPDALHPSTFTSVWHPLDQTLIPLDWYGVAALAAATALGTAGVVGGGHTTAVLTLADFCQRECQYKRDLVDARASQRELTSKVRAADPSSLGLPSASLGEREVEFVLEELIACGESHLRRPYRRLSSRELMLCIAGMIFITKEEAGSFPRRARDGRAGERSTFIVHEGDYITGTVAGVREGVMPGIRMATSREMDAFVSAADIPEEAMRVELLEYVRRLEVARDARKRGEAEPDGGEYETPDWLRRGAILHGTVIRCNWQRCELQVRWCRPRDVEVSGTHGCGSGVSTDSVAFATAVRDAASSANSLKTIQMERDAVVFATKIFRHPLFRDVSNARANALLRDKEIGEVLLRPATGRHNKAVCVVKLGTNCTCSIMISEERRPTGQVFYRLRDSVVDQTLEFDDVDEFLSRFIAPMVDLVMTVRQHRRFEESPHDVIGALADQERDGRTFAYVFAECGQVSKPPLYRVHTRGGGRDHRFRLHITDKHIYVRLPFRGKQPTMPAEFKWIECRNAEHVSETVKRHATAHAN